MAPKEQILFIREKVIHLYKSYEKIMLPMLKFFLMLLTFVMVNNQIGMEENLMNPVVVFLLAIAGGFCPPHLMLLLIMGFTTMHLISFQLMLGVTAGLFFVVLYILFIRLYPKESLLILVAMLALKMNVEYLLLFVTPLVGGIASLIALVIGLVLFYLGGEISYLMQEPFAVGEVKDYITLLLQMVEESVLDNKTLLVSITIFSVVFLVIYMIRKLSVDYSVYVAIGTGAVINLLGFIMAIFLLQIEINIANVFIMSVIGSVFAAFASFLIRPLDYSRGESVQFEDEDNYYYVKVVPKIQVRTNTAKVKQVYIPTGERKIEE